MTLLLELDKETIERLAFLAKETNKTESFYIQKLLDNHLEDLEDLYLTEARFEGSQEYITFEKVKKKYELEK